MVKWHLKQLKTKLWVSQKQESMPYSTLTFQYLGVLNLQTWSSQKTIPQTQKSKSSQSNLRTIYTSLKSCWLYICFQAGGWGQLPMQEMSPLPHALPCEVQDFKTFKVPSTAGRRTKASGSSRPWNPNGGQHSEYLGKWVNFCWTLVEDLA